MRNAVLSIGLALALLASIGCSLGSIGSRSESKARSGSGEIAALKAQIVELQRRAAIADVEIGRLQKRLAELENGTRQESTGADVQAAKPVSRELPPKPEPVALPPDKSSERPGIDSSDLPVEPVVPAPAGSESDSGTDKPTASQSSALTESAQALYDRGYTLFHRGHYVDSETAFQQFLSRYSTTVLGDNAQFWIAEARYARNDVNGALAAYRETATRFPSGNKVPDALLKAGDCLLELGDEEAARRSFREVIEVFPGSAAASAARERLGRSL